jgi:hypothetical protein
VDPRQENNWEKGQGIQSNVGHVNDITCIDIVFIREIESGL